MPRLSELLEKNRARKLLEQYSRELHVPVFLLDKDKNVSLAFPEDGLYAALASKPVVLREKTIGYVAVPAECCLKDSQLEFLSLNLSVVLEMSYEIESLSGEVARNYEEISLLWKLSARLGAGLDVDTICGILVDEVMSLCPVKTVVLFLTDHISSDSLIPSLDRNARNEEKGEKTVFFPKACLGEYAKSASIMTLPADSGLLKSLSRLKEPLTVCDIANDERFTCFPYPLKSILVVPLTVEDEVIGVIIASDKLTGEEFYTTEIKLIFNMASECAISIKKAFFFDEIRSMLFSTAEAFSLAIDAKDAYTYGHSRRVADISVAIARKMALPPEVVNWTRLAALLHDIGKIGTPETILHKNGQLDVDELTMMKEHPVTGEKMIKHIPRFRELSRWIRYHHEKYDGTGYPFGIGGEDIPLVSRIIAVADCYDALTTDRPYRKAYDRDEAVKTMRETAGTHFDPVIFGYFEEVVR